MKSRKYVPSHKKLKNFTSFKIPYFTKKTPLTELFFLLLHLSLDFRSPSAWDTLSIIWKYYRMIGSKNRNLKMQHNLQRIGGENNRYNYTFIQPMLYACLFWYLLDISLEEGKSNVLSFVFVCVIRLEIGLSTVLTFSKKQFCLCWLFSSVRSDF